MQRYFRAAALVVSLGIAAPSAANAAIITFGTFEELAGGSDGSAVTGGLFSGPTELSGGSSSGGGNRSSNSGNSGGGTSSTVENSSNVLSTFPSGGATGGYQGVVGPLGATSTGASGASLSSGW